MYRAFILVLFCLTEEYQINSELPGFLTQCKDNAEISKCTKQVLEDLRPRLIKGIPELQLPSIDPLYIPWITIQRRNSRIADYTANITNARWTGCKDFQIMDTFVSIDKLVFRMKLAFPYLLLDAEASLRGTFLNFEIDSSGGALINYTNVVLDIVLNGKLYKYKGKEFVNWEAEDIGVTYDGVYYLDLYGFFEDPSVTNLFKIAVNNGARLLGTTYRPIASAIGDFIVEAINRVFKLYPKDVLYPVRMNTL